MFAVGMPSCVLDQMVSFEATKWNRSAYGRLHHMVTREGIVATLQVKAEGTSKDDTNELTAGRHSTA